MPEEADIETLQLPLSTQPKGLPQAVAKLPVFEERSSHEKWLYAGCRRAADIVFSALALVAAAPALAVIALLIQVDDPGPKLFRHQRLGKNGEMFDCLKFRTMYIDAEERLQRDPKLLAEFQQQFKLKNDPRVTKIGRFLRKSSLDELPQLWNVLQGNMSLIGPRPIVQAELEKYGSGAQDLLQVKPGLGGLWQVCGRSSTSYSVRVNLDLLYVRHRSLTLDLRLAILTARAVLRREGAC